MRRFFLNISFFIIIVFSVFIVLSKYHNIDKDSSQHPNIIRLNESINHQDLDILFIGNSYCYCAINPRVFEKAGLNVYNLGISTAGPMMYRYLLIDYLNQVSNWPSKIILSYSLVTFSSGSDNWSTYPIHHYLSKPISNAEIAIENGSIKLFFSLLYNSAKKGVSNLFLSKKESKKVDLFKGYINDEKELSQSDYEKSNHLYLNYRKDNFNEVKFNQLIELIELCENLGIQVEFVEIPSYLFDNFVNENYKEAYFNSKKKLVKLGVKLHEVSIPNEKKYYRNIDHMNSNGADLFSSRLIERINKGFTIK